MERQGWNERNLFLNMSYANCNLSIKDIELDGWRLNNADCLQDSVWSKQRIVAD
jgi:hypothetical protein